MVGSRCATSGTGVPDLARLDFDRLRIRGGSVNKDGGEASSHVAFDPIRSNQDGYAHGVEGQSASNRAGIELALALP